MTYRASRDWGARLGYSHEALEDANHACLALYREVATEVGLAGDDVVISGCVGPKSDAYDGRDKLSAEAAEAYHGAQIETFRKAGADVVTALSLNASQEALGIARAARPAGLPVALSFLVEKDHRLPSGETLGAAIETVDQATERAVAYYMINCSHPLDFGPALVSDRGSRVFTASVRTLRATTGRS